MYRFVVKYIAVFCIFLTSHVFAANCNYWGTPTEYKVTLKKVMICQDYSITTGLCTGANDFTVGTHSMTCDIASVGTNTDACDYAALTGMPFGETYNYLWVQISRDFTLTATGTMDSGDCTGFTVRTESSYTNTTAQISHGVVEAVGSTNAAESQVLTMSTWNANDTTGCEDDCLAQEKDKANSSCTMNTITSHVDNSYTYTADVCSPDYGIWIGNLTGTTFDMIYNLVSPYTVGLVTPKLTMSFDTTQAFLTYYSSTDTEGGFAMIIPGEPVVTLALVD